MLSAIGRALARGETVTFTGFGRYYREEPTGPRGPEPATGECIAVDASNSVCFEAGKALREAVN